MKFKTGGKAHLMPKLEYERPKSVSRRRHMTPMPSNERVEKSAGKKLLEKPVSWNFKNGGKIRINFHPI